jgi:VWFA-related protein
MKVGMRFYPAFALSCLIFLSCMPLTAQQAGAPQDAPYKIDVRVNRLLVPVVVRDAQGHTVGNLKKEDFQVFSNNKPQLISGFSIQQRGTTKDNTASAPGSVTQQTVSPDTLPDHITVFLFDDMHLTAEDLAHAREAGMKILSGALTGTAMAAVVSISGRVNTGLTRDTAKLQEALAKLQPMGLYRADNMDCPHIDYYEADLIENKHDPVAVQDANQKFANCNNMPTVATPSNIPTAERSVESAAIRALALGHQDTQSTYASIAQFVRRMAPLPGRRTLILVSAGFLNIERDSLGAESRIIDLAVQSDVTISSLDARGLYTTELSASERSPALSGQSLQVNLDYHRNSMKLAENPMAELADGTGGTFFHNSNDLDAGFKSLTQVPEYVYVLEFPLNNVKQDGSYHHLKVKVDREGLRLQARQGYFVPRPKKNKS